MRFQDRRDAGRQLARLLEQYAKRTDVLVIGLPRGGMITAAAVAQELGLPIDLLVVRKIGAPHNPELAIGALTQDGVLFLNDELVRSMGVSKNELDSLIEVEKKELARRLSCYRPGRGPLQVTGKNVLLVDDGIATGATVRAAISWLRAQRAEKIVLAVPVMPSDSVQALRAAVDELYVLYVPDIFWGVGDFYDQFAQTTDEEVIGIMQR